MDAVKTAFYHSPIGLIRLEAEDEALTGLGFVTEEETARHPARREPPAGPILQRPADEV